MEQTPISRICFGHGDAACKEFAPGVPAFPPGALAVEWSVGGREVKQDLMLRLLERVSLGTVFSRAELVQTDLGRPILLLDGEPGPYVSFSYDGRGRVFAVICLMSPVGLDAAHPDEFSGSYPFGRAFVDDELDQALALTGSRTDAAALVWAFKEAAVKAMGSGFHRVDPRHVLVDDLQCRAGRYRAFVRANRMMIPARACRLEDYYLALALDNSAHSSLCS